VISLASIAFSPASSGGDALFSKQPLFGSPSWGYLLGLVILLMLGGQWV
jgi:hypothetical protein